MARVGSKPLRNAKVWGSNGSLVGDQEPSYFPKHFPRKAFPGGKAPPFRFPRNFPGGWAKPVLKGNPFPLAKVSGRGKPRVLAPRGFGRPPVLGVPGKGRKLNGEGRGNPRGGRRGSFGLPGFWAGPHQAPKEKKNPGSGIPQFPNEGCWESSLSQGCRTLGLGGVSRPRGTLLVFRPFGGGVFLLSRRRFTRGGLILGGQRGPKGGLGPPKFLFRLKRGPPNFYTGAKRFEENALTPEGKSFPGHFLGALARCVCKNSRLLNIKPSSPRVFV